MPRSPLFDRFLIHFSFGIFLLFSATFDLQAQLPTQANVREAIDLPASQVISVDFGTSDPAGIDIFTTPVSSFPVDGSDYLVLSTGSTSDALTSNNSTNTSTELNGLNTPFSSGPSNLYGPHDLVQLTLVLVPPSWATCLAFDFQFYSEEFPEWIASDFNDVFIAEYGQSNYSYDNGNFQVVAPNNFAYDSNGNPVAVNSASSFNVTANNATGTTYDGATSLLTARTPIDNTNPITITLSIMDIGDSIYDSTVFIDNFRWLNIDCTPGATEYVPPTPPYCTYQNLEVYCDPSGLNYIWTFEVGVVGADGASIEVVPWTDFGAFPGTFVPPMPWSLPIPDGSTVQFTGEISGIPAGYDSFMADIIIRDAQGMIICAPETQVNLPNCCVSSPGPGPGEIQMNIECLTEEEGDGFSFSAEIVNHSGFDIVKIFIPDVVDPTSGVTLVDIEPNVIVPATPIATGDLLPDLDLNFGGGASGDDFPLTVVLMAKDESGQLFECCSRDLDVSLPVCCNDLVEDSLTVHCQDADGNFQLDFSFLNWGHIEPTAAAHAFLLPISPTDPGVFFEPDYIDLELNGGQVIDGNLSALLTTSISGAGLNQEITFELIIHNEDMSECCNQVHTIFTSDCTAGGGGGGATSSEASFLRGDANTDGSFDIADVILSLGYLFQDLPVSCLLALDSNDDQTVDIGDSIYSLNALFGGGPSPGPPHQQCGDDTSAGTLDCDSFPLCDTANNDPQGG